MYTVKGHLGLDTWIAEKKYWYNGQCTYVKSECLNSTSTS